jgi:hypothetical protein
MTRAIVKFANAILKAATRFAPRNLCVMRRVSRLTNRSLWNPMALLAGTSQDFAGGQQDFPGASRNVAGTT